MTLHAPMGERHWLIGGAAAVIGHAAVIAGVLATGAVTPIRIVEDPVVLVELPPPGSATAPPADAEAEEIAPSLQDKLQPPNSSRPDVPVVRAPLPREVPSVPPQRLQPLQRMAVAVPAQTSVGAARPVPAASVPAAPSGHEFEGPDQGSDPKAKQQEADYYALLAAHLNRKKHYPPEAKKARQQGIVTVRFTVHSDGRISATSIRRSSGHDLLDRATLDLMQRVAPLPEFPQSMNRDSVTISLPIAYSLRTS